MEQDAKNWLQGVDGLVGTLKSKWQTAAEDTLKSSFEMMPLFPNERVETGEWLTFTEPKGPSKEEVLLISSSKRLIFISPGSWTRSEWNFWAGTGAVKSVSISGWMFQQSNAYEHFSTSYLRLDFMFSNLESFSFFKTFRQPKQLIPLARIMQFLVNDGAKVTNNSQEFEMAYDAIS